ncbi:MAG TPA: hypothetical protein D7I06_05430 [Candidatus Poseidoniales archaeon]|nr:MAG TPA: hypothetical protein D7I06_05430 [Candidatus Poseidoniales archaeon]HII63029.1 hypothetical protein [Candidatus Poseidoniaceae archaeon]
MGAPNPWHHSLPTLDSKNQLLEGEHPLDMIRDFLLEWPGEETVKLLGFGSRHDRLAQIVGGYPEISTNRFPMDWPLHPKSLKSLRLSRYIDSLPSFERGISLRSALLNQDASIRRLDLNDKKRSYRRFIAILFIGIREDFGIEQEGFTDKELRLLGSLHSSESTRIDRCWPWEEISYYNLTKRGGEPSLNKNLDPFWKTNDDLKTSIQGDVWGIKFQKIQSWILHWSASDSDTGLTARLIRGASSLIENAMSSIRHSVIEEFGIGSIVIDGGGRLEFVAEYDPNDLLNRSVSRTFDSYDNDSYTPTYSLEIRRAFDRWEGLVNELDFYNMLENFLPPFNIYNVPQSVEKRDLTEEIQFKKNDTCPLCNGEIELDNKLKNKWPRLVSNIEHKVCDFHVLLYYIGQAQRYLDSAVRNSGKGVKTKNKQRKVSSIARLDLNSLGLLFVSSFDDSENRSLDVIRRRSFRFNSQWWQLIQEVVDSSNYTVDKIAAWMAAGDDIILAEYQAEKGEENESALGILLSNLAFKLSDLSDEEFVNSRLTFSGGIANRKKGESIQECLKRASDLEKRSKYFWRGYMLEKGETEYILNEHGETKDFSDFNELKISGENAFKLSRNSLWISDRISF